MSPFPRFRQHAISRSAHLAAASFLAIVAPTAHGQLCAETFDAYRIPNGAAGVSSADLTGDGWADLALSIYTTNKVTILRNVGDGTFTQHADIALSGRPFMSVCVDFDVDGDIDLAVANYNTSIPSNVISVLSNLGGGNFGPELQLPVDFSPGLVAADLDGDGDPDLAAFKRGTSSAGNVLVFQNLGGGNFAVPVQWPIGFGCFGFAASDFDGDGDIDLAAGESQGDEIAMLPNLGSGAFGAPIRRSSIASPGGMTAADFDQDGDVDLVLTTSTAAVLGYHANHGDGTFAAYTTIALPAIVDQVIAADLDADGDQDLAATRSLTDTFLVLKNQGVASFAPAVRLVAPFEPVSPVAAELDGDGDLDLALVGHAVGDVDDGVAAVYENYGDGSFPNQPSYPAGNGPFRVAAADLDGDGAGDLVVAYHLPGGLSWMRNVGEARFGPPTPLPSSADTHRVALADLDGDGDCDIVSGSTHVRVHVNLGQGTFAPPTSYDSGGWATDIAIADFDSDGDADVATCNTSLGTVNILANVGTATFQPPITFPAGASPENLVAGDVDGDGDSDLVTADYWGNVITVLRNLGGAVFAPAEVHPMPAGPWELGLFDLDGDGDVDLAVADGRNLFVFENPGNGVFLSPVVHAAFMFGSIAGSDLDGDGDIDFAGHGSSGVTLLENLGGLVFAQPLLVGVGSYPSDVACSDLDGDGDIEVISANQDGDSVTIVRGCAQAGTAFCAGDGSATACPCGNASPAGAGLGCTNSLGLAGGLRASGLAHIGADTIVLEGTGMPDASALYFQGTTMVNGGAGAVFGDGLRCAGGAVARLATKLNAGGASSYPGTGEPSVSVRGAIVVPGERVYQVWYRNAASFCTPSTFNLTNGLRIVWTF